VRSREYGRLETIVDKERTLMPGVPPNRRTCLPDWWGR
jgi:hypothetical protein